MAFMSHLNHAISQPCNFLEAGVNQISKIRKWWIHFLGRNVAYWRITYIFICLKSHICTVWAYLIFWMYRMLYGYIKIDFLSSYHVLSELLFNISIYIILYISFLNYYDGTFWTPNLYHQSSKYSKCNLATSRPKSRGYDALEDRSFPPDLTVPGYDIYL